jgi:hypothetical protein
MDIFVLGAPSNVLRPAPVRAPPLHIPPMIYFITPQI